MGIYTRTGDDGTTGIFGNKRVSKGSAQVEANGTIDELSSWLGVVMTAKLQKSHHNLLSTVQERLYDAMAILSGMPWESTHLLADCTDFEKMIDAESAKLPELRNFILPQGTLASVNFHVARTICRRAERAVCRYADELAKLKSKSATTTLATSTLASTNHVIQYLNRLSDLLFVLSRSYNQGHEIIIKH